jgi:hypothetical protein
MDGVPGTPRPELLVYGKKDWRRCFLLLAPNARGKVLAAIFFIAGFGDEANKAKAVKVIEEHFRPSSGDSIHN